MTQGQDFEKAFKMLTTINSEQLNLTEARALLYIGQIACSSDQALLPNVTEIASALEMSHSGASRLLANLLSRDAPLISTDKARYKGRSEAYFVTERGKQALGRLVASVGKRNRAG